MANLDSTQAISKIFNNESFSFSFQYFSEDITRSVNALFAKLLGKVDKIYILDMLVTVMRELCVNAIKANAKRVYFENKKFDINDTEKYNEGLRSFKTDIIGQFETIQNDLIKSTYLVTINLVKNNNNNTIVIKIINNTPIMPEELERLKFRFKKAEELNNFGEAFDEIYDDSEGAGLGIVLTVLILKNCGIGANNLQITSNGSNTSAILTIPEHLRPEATTSSVKEKILSDVSGLPTFPRHIIELQELCNNPEAFLTVIVEKVEIDPALVSDVLKLANSAGFFPSKRIETISDAVKVIGLKNLNSILIAISSRTILDKRYSKFEQIWNHCNRTAFYARKLAVKFKLRTIFETAFLSGLLHDLGKIVLLSTNLDLTNKIADIVKDRKIRTSTVMEEVSIGISHASLGELIAIKWEFPEYLTQAIKYHHSPLNVKEEFRDLIYITYLANMICGIEAKKYHFGYIEEDVLNYFHISSEDEFNQLCIELQKEYKV